MKYDAGADAYDRLTGRWSRLYASALVEAADASHASVVLDLATGTGDAALVASQRVKAAGTVIGVDISVPMLRVANTKPSVLKVHFVAADGMALPFADGTFDAVICQFGLMFFPNRVTALMEIRRVLRPSGRVALTVWGPPDRAPFAGIMAQALGSQLPTIRDELLLPFALGNPIELKQLLTFAGLRDIHIALQTRLANFDSVDDFLDPYEQGGGRLGQAYLQLPPVARATVRQTALSRLADYTQGNGITMELDAYLASGIA